MTLALLKRARAQLPAAAAFWNMGEDRTVADFHVAAVLEFIKEIDAAIAAGQPEDCSMPDKVQVQRETAGAAGAAGAAGDAGDAAFCVFAQREMPWLLGEMLDDTDRLMRGTAAIAFEAGRKAEREGMAP